MKEKAFDCEKCIKRNVCKYIDDMERINLEISDVVEKENDIIVNHVIIKCHEYEEFRLTRSI